MFCCVGVQQHADSVSVCCILRVILSVCSVATLCGAILLLYLPFPSSPSPLSRFCHFFRAFRSANVVLPPFVTKRWLQKCPQGTSVGIGRRFSLSGHKRLRCFAHPLRALEPPSDLFPPAVHCGDYCALRATMISVAAIYFQQAGGLLDPAM